MIASPSFAWTAAHAAAASLYAGSIAWRRNCGDQPEGIPTRLELWNAPVKFAVGEIRTGTADRAADRVMFVDVVLYDAKAALQFAIGVRADAIRSYPPLSRSMDFEIEPLTNVWIPDIVAIVNMIKAMLARVAPVRNFLFIGYAIAVRTTGRHVRLRTMRVPTASNVSLLNMTSKRPPRTRKRPARMNRVMSAVAVLKNFQGLRTHPMMNAPARLNTRRAGTTRIVRMASPSDRVIGPRSCRMRLCRRRATAVRSAPSPESPAPSAT